MPIYSDKLMSSQYKVVKKISVMEFRNILNEFKKAKTVFPYKDKVFFLKTIELDDAGKSIKDYEIKSYIDSLFDTKYREGLKGKFPFIAKFENHPKYHINDYNYSVMLKSLINHTNDLLDRKPNLRKYRLDICGSWTNGKVIILIKK